MKASAIPTRQEGLRKAIGAYQKLIDLGRLSISKRSSRMGRCYEKAGKAREALEHYRSFINVSPKSDGEYRIEKDIQS